MNQGVCNPGAIQGCGLCGSQMCNGSGQWDNCGAQGVCTPGTIDPNSYQVCPTCWVRQCGGSCTWGACYYPGSC
jgi:hypothetical protein